MLSRRVRWVLIGADVLWVATAIFLAFLLRYDAATMVRLTDPLPWGPILIMLVGGVASWVGMYKILSLDSLSKGWSLPATVSRIALGGTIQMAVILAAAYLARVYFSRLVLAYFAIGFCSLALLARVIMYKLLCAYHRNGRNRRVVVVGEGRVATELLRRVERHPELLYQVVARLNPWMQSGIGTNTPVSNGSTQLSSLDVLDLLKEWEIQEVIVCMDRPPVAEMQSFFAHCLDRGISVSVVPQPYELFSSRARLSELQGIPLVTLENLPDFQLATAFKRAVDVVLAPALLALAIPVVAVCAAVLKYQGRGFLRRELRAGQNGRPFRMYRLDIDRTALDATAFQRFICRVSISELPQLLNVLWGQMSLVGPRPEPPEKANHYSEWERRRLRIKPGMTGLAQVNGLREQHSSAEKTRFDLQYIVHWTPLTDLVLLLETVWILAARLRTRETKVIHGGSGKQMDRAAQVA